MQKLYHLQAFELFSVLCSFDDTMHENTSGTLKKLALKLDGYLEGTECIQIYKQKYLYQKEQQSSDEGLFIDLENLPLRYANHDILNEKERLVFYVSILIWIGEYGFRDDLAIMARRFLNLDKQLIRDVDHFLNGDLCISTTTRNELFHLVPQDGRGESLEGKWITSNQPKDTKNSNLFPIKGLSHAVNILFVDSWKIFFIRSDEISQPEVSGWKSGVYDWDFVEPGGAVELGNEIFLEYFDLKCILYTIRNFKKLSLEVDGVSYMPSPGKQIGKLDLAIESGTLVGILGREGAGKSTILSLLAGELPPASGDIFINGYPYSSELFHLKGMIGYVPEEDMLFDELSVFDNVYYSARLFLGYLGATEIRKKVRELLVQLDLWGLADQVVGPFEAKKLQPGQRRLLNLALELIRDPQVLIVDNATAPLSLSDSSKVIQVLSTYTFSGHLVITSITQTEESIFQYFDRLLLLDDHGRPALYQSVRNATETLLDTMGLKADVIKFPGPGQVLNFLDVSLKVSEGKFPYVMDKPAAYGLDLPGEKSVTSHGTGKKRRSLPENILRPPTLDRQYIIFSLRNFKTKLSRTRELLLTLFSAPLLALFFALTMRGDSSAGYSFSMNPNIPVFFFLSFLFAVFFGLVLSAKEIFRERRIIQKQTYLNISKFSYINSKITYLFILAALQSFFFTGITHLLLQIRGMLLVHWLIFFSCQSFGLLFGLLLSESHRTLESIYSRSIPLILIVLLLFGGGMIEYSKLSKQKEYSPLIGELMVSKGAWEAMMVYQATRNDYAKEFYPYDKRISEGRINSNYTIPLIMDQIEYCRRSFSENPDSAGMILESVRNRLITFRDKYDLFPYENIDSLTTASFSSAIAEDLLEYLEYTGLQLKNYYKEVLQQKEEHERQLTNSRGKEYIRNLKNRYTNAYVMHAVCNASFGQVLETSFLPPVQLIDQIYQDPKSKLGRTLLFVPKKNVNGQLIDTLEFNLSIIWLFNFLLYILLLTDFFSFSALHRILGKK
ncbi:MAG: ATP-binding cassette domain-containing protein [Bacteroidales bacterium]|nr:ATP-binding cassette domain-containing protein [Bacteroidales bacterium]